MFLFLNRRWWWKGLIGKRGGDGLENGIKLAWNTSWRGVYLLCKDEYRKATGIYIVEVGHLLFIYMDINPLLG